MKMTLGTGAATNSLDEIALAKTILVCGANPTDGHPVTGARIKQAARHGAHLIIVDPREIELCEFATLHLQLHAGTNVVLFNAIGAAIIDEGLADEEFIRTRLTEYSEYVDFIRDFMPEKVAEVCGVPAEKIRAAARLYPSHWFAEAMREAVVANVRSWRYVHKILQKWAKDGRDSHLREPALSADHYTEGVYGDLFRRGSDTSDL
jgi:predicted molibdopterin-dependent oxidoreductase YjgC